MRTTILAILLALGLTAPAGAAWRRPVPGVVARPFTYTREAPFRAGAHRGVDLSAPPGTLARAACTGVVATAAWSVVTLRCGLWRVTALPLTSLRVRVGEHVRAGLAIGRVGSTTAHTGLHVGVRRAGDPFAYVDPEPLLRGVSPRPPVTAPPSRAGPRGGPSRPPVTAAPSRVGPRGGAPAAAGQLAATPNPAPARGVAPAPAAPAAPAPVRGVAPAPAAPAAAAPASAASRGAAGALGAPGLASRRLGPAALASVSAAAALLRVPAPAGVRVSAARGRGGLAPWPAWVGLGLLAVGAVGGGVRVGRRRRSSPLAEPAAEAVPSAP